MASPDPCSRYHTGPGPKVEYESEILRIVGPPICQVPIRLVTTHPIDSKTARMFSIGAPVLEESETLSSVRSNVLKRNPKSQSAMLAPLQCPIDLEDDCMPILSSKPMPAATFTEADSIDGSTAEVKHLRSSGRTLRLSTINQENDADSTKNTDDDLTAQSRLFVPIPPPPRTLPSPPAVVKNEANRDTTAIEEITSSIIEQNLLPPPAVSLDDSTILNLVSKSAASVSGSSFRSRRMRYSASVPALQEFELKPFLQLALQKSITAVHKTVLCEDEMPVANPGAEKHIWEKLVDMDMLSPTSNDADSEITDGATDRQEIGLCKSPDYKNGIQSKESSVAVAVAAAVAAFIKGIPCHGKRSRDGCQVRVSHLEDVNFLSVSRRRERRPKRKVSSCSYTPLLETFHEECSGSEIDGNLLPEEVEAPQLVYPPWLKMVNRLALTRKPVPVPHLSGVQVQCRVTTECSGTETSGSSNSNPEQTSDLAATGCRGRVRASRSRCTGDIIASNSNVTVETEESANNRLTPELLPSPSLRSDCYGFWMRKQCPNLLSSSVTLATSPTNVADGVWDGCTSSEMASRLFSLIQQQDFHGITALMDGNVEQFQKNTSMKSTSPTVLPLSINVSECKDDLGNTPIIAAACIGAKRILRHLLRYGFPIDGTNAFGNTALHFAAEFSFKSLSKMLIRKGALQNICNEMGQVAGERLEDEVNFS